MKTDPIRNEKCIRGGCYRWFGAIKAGLKTEACSRCGFDKEEDAMRKQLPLTLCEDGLRRKLIPAKAPVAMPPEEEKETEE